MNYMHSMRRILDILSFFLMAALPALSQARTGSPQDPELKFIKFYPNPAVSFITFDFQNGFDRNDRNYSFVIFNFLGKKVYETSTLGSKTFLVNLSDFFRGVYIFQLRDQTGKIVESSKFQVIK